MKRWIQISLVLALVAVLVLSALPVGMTTALPGGVEPNVGWNRGPISYAPAQAVAFIFPVIQPCVGWNT